MPRKELIVALETASRMGSVAIGTDQELFAERAFSAPLKHSQELFPAAQDLLQRVHAGPGDIKQIFVSIGPGSFTGLRIAVSVAKAMSLGADVKIVAVDTLDVIAANALETLSSRPACIATVLDAKRGQFFMAGYRLKPGNAWGAPAAGDAWTKLMEDRIITAEAFTAEFATANGPVGLLGDGLVFHQDKFAHSDINILPESLWTPRAVGVYELGRAKARQGQFTDPLDLVPRYLRAPLVTLKRGH